MLITKRLEDFLQSLSDSQANLFLHERDGEQLGICITGSLEGPGYDANTL